MKKKTSHKAIISADIDMLPEYDFTGGVRGKHYKARQQGYTIKIHKADGTTLAKHIKREKTITLDREVRKYFPDSRAVNDALRTLIALFSQEPKKAARGGHRFKNGKRAAAKSGV